MGEQEPLSASRRKNQASRRATENQGWHDQAERRKNKAGCRGSRLPAEKSRWSDHGEQQKRQKNTRYGEETVGKRCHDHGSEEKC